MAGVKALFHALMVTNHSNKCVPFARASTQRGTAESQACFFHECRDLKIEVWLCQESHVTKSADCEIRSPGLTKEFARLMEDGCLDQLY